MNSDQKSPLLSLDLSVDYPGKPGVLRHAAFDMAAGEIVGLVGQSGSGKSTLALAILKLLNLKGGRAEGVIRFRGRDLMALSEREMRSIRGREISLVLQSPLASLNPALRINTQLLEAWRAHCADAGAAWKARVMELLESVSLPAEESFLRQYPRQLSVGLAQRVLIALAILHRPPLLIADEPTSALDVVTQADILALFGRLSRELNMGVLFISHDLLSVASLCHRVAILHQGEIVEFAETARIFQSPAHPYTQQLISALPAMPATRAGATIKTSTL